MTKDWFHNTLLLDMGVVFLACAIIFLKPTRGGGGGGTKFQRWSWGSRFTTEQCLLTYN